MMDQTDQTLSITPSFSQFWEGPSPMIDWLSVLYRLVNASGKVVDPASVEGLRGNPTLILDPSSGEVISEGFTRRRIGPRTDCTAFSIHTQIRAGELFISGNLAKFIQGHNLFSALQPWEAVQEWEKALLQRVGIPDHRLVLQRISRIDLTQEVDCVTREACQATLLAFKANWSAHKRRKTIEDHGVYLGKGSARWSLKAYCKQLPSSKGASASGQPDISEFLRIELCLRPLGMKAAKLDPTNPRAWNLFEVFRSHLECCRLPLGARGLRRKDRLSMRPNMRGYLERWRNGDDLSRDLPPSTFFRIRNKLLELGIDIKSVPGEEQSNEIQPLSWAEVLDPTRWHATSFSAEAIAGARSQRSARGGAATGRHRT